MVPAPITAIFFICIVFNDLLFCDDSFVGV